MVSGCSKWLLLDQVEAWKWTLPQIKLGPNPGDRRAGDLSGGNLGGSGGIRRFSRPHLPAPIPGLASQTLGSPQISLQQAIMVAAIVWRPLKGVYTQMRDCIYTKAKKSLPQRMQKNWQAQLDAIIRKAFGPNKRALPKLWSKTLDRKSVALSEKRKGEMSSRSAEPISSRACSPVCNFAPHYVIRCI